MLADIHATRQSVRTMSNQSACYVEDIQRTSAIRSICYSCRRILDLPYTRHSDGAVTSLERLCGLDVTLEGCDGYIFVVVEVALFFVEYVGFIQMNSG